MRFYHFWFEPVSERVRLALGAKGIAHERVIPDYDDDETFFDLGVARQAPVWRWADGRVETDSLAIVRALDSDQPDPPLFAPLQDGQWQALQAWRLSAADLLERLYAPVRPAYRGLGDHPSHLASYKASVAARLGASMEELANDRYGAYAQLDALTRFKDLGVFLAQHRFYAGAFSAADVLLTADLFPLQLQDGITLPIDIMYYFERVQDVCGVDLRDGLIGGPLREGS